MTDASSPRFEPIGDWVDPTDVMIERMADGVVASAVEADQALCRAVEQGVEQIAWISRPEQLEEPKLAFLLIHWQELAAKRGGPPDRHDIDVLDLVPAIGNLMVLEVERAGFDAVYRVYGTGVAERAGRDWTGYRVSEMNRITRTPAALLYRTCYRAVYRRPEPLFSAHASAHWVSSNAWRRLILPLADGGTGCARFLVGNLPVGQRLMSNSDVQAQQARVRSG